MKYYVLRPDLTPYEGMIVNKDSKLEFKNEKVEQKLENLKFLLFENENRGWFLPAQSIGTIETAINDYKTLAEVLDGDKDDTRGNEN